MPDPNGGWLQQPYPGSPSQTNADAMMAVGIMQGLAGPTAPPTPEQLRRARRRRLVRTIVFAVLSVGFLIGALSDWMTGHNSYMPSLILGIIFVILTSHQLVRSATSRLRR